MTDDERKLLLAHFRDADGNPWSADTWFDIEDGIDTPLFRAIVAQCRRLEAAERWGEPGDRPCEPGQYALLWPNAIGSYPVYDADGVLYCGSFLLSDAYYDNVRFFRLPDRPIPQPEKEA
jgi:hypothetical protein